MRQLKKNLHRFASSIDGNFAIISALMTVPLALAIGLSVDFSRAVNQRSAMRNALDAATLSLATLPQDATRAQREARLQQVYSANAGLGTTTLLSFSINNTGELDAQTSALAPSQTTFMNLANINNIDVEVGAAVHKEPTLVSASFKIDRASGHWNKTMTLHGKRYGETNYAPLMEISYTYNDYVYTSGGSKYREPKGYGRTIIYDINGGVKTKIQEKNCTTAKVNNFNGAADGDIKYNGNPKMLTKCEMILDGTATEDVSLMEKLYLEMVVPKKDTTLNKTNPDTRKTMRSDDPTTSNHIFFGKIKKINNKDEMVYTQTPKGEVVNIFTDVPCGETSSQAWEDGGNDPDTAANADFFYTVVGRCNYSQRPVGISMTK